MNKKQRLDIPGTLFYVQLKSNGHRELFADREEYSSFCQLLQNLKAEDGSETLAYCLLNESVHLVLRAGREGISGAGRWLSSHYTEWYNDHHKRNGSIFHTHVPCVLIEAKHYLLPVIFQIHRLPITLGLVPDPAIYPWCSHNAYLNHSQDHWLERDTALNLIANQRASRSRRYDDFIRHSNLPTLDWINGVHPHFRALASETYVAKLLEQQEKTEQSATPSIEELIDAVCAEYHLNRSDLSLRRHHRLASEVHTVIASLALSFKSANFDEIAETLEQKPEILEQNLRSLRADKEDYLYRLQQKLSTTLKQKPMIDEAADDPTDEIQTLTEIDELP